MPQVSNGTGTRSKQSLSKPGNDKSRRRNLWPYCCEAFARLSQTSRFSTNVTLRVSATETDAGNAGVTQPRGNLGVSGGSARSDAAFFPRDPNKCSCGVHIFLLKWPPPDLSTFLRPMRQPRTTVGLPANGPASADLMDPARRHPCRMDATTGHHPFGCGHASP